MSRYLVAYATILALRKNIDEKKYETEESYVEQFHHALQDIENSIGKDFFCADDFALEQKNLKPTLTSYNSHTQQSTYSSSRYCETQLLFVKVDAALNYLQLIAPKEEKKQMGFGR